MQEDLNRYYLCKPGIISNMADHEEFSNLFREFEKQHAGIAQREPKVGDSVQGRIISIQKDCAFIDLGAKTEGIVGIDELTDADGNLTVAVGDTIEITVSGRDAASGTLLLGNQQARHTRGAEELRRAFEQGASVEGRVSGVIKGGLEVEISGERAFCPAPQIDIQYIDDLEHFDLERADLDASIGLPGHSPVDPNAVDEGPVAGLVLDEPPLAVMDQERVAARDAVAVEDDVVFRVTAEDK